MAFDRSETTMRPFTADELPDVARFIEGVFLSDYHEEDIDLDRRLFEPERSLGIFAGEDLLASTAIYSRNLTVPGGPIPTAAVTAVAVAPTHRRRGLLTALMRSQLDDLQDGQRETVAILWASEAAIYGRYGYGPAVAANHLDIASTQTRMRRDVPRDGRLRLCSRDEAMPAMAAVYEAVRADRVGHLDRPGPWWDARTYDSTRHRDGGSTLRYAVHTDDDGRADGYAIFRVKDSWGPSGPNGEVAIREVVASSPGGYAAVWALLLEMDLVRQVRWDRAAPDEPVRYLVDNPRAVQQRLVDSLWVRLVDVGAALAARTYATAVDVVLGVEDSFCPWNSRRYRLSGGPDGAQCTPTTDAADLHLPVAALGAAYLGGVTLGTLAAAGWVTEARAGALAATSTAFGTTRSPSIPEVF